MSRKQTPAAPATQAALYLRVSTAEQANTGYGLDVQRERTTAQALVKGWTVYAEYLDAGVSGTLGMDERDGLKAMLEAAEAGAFQAVIVLALDRLARKTVIALAIIERLTAAGVAVVSCKEALDTSTAQGQFVLTMFSAIAQLERDVIAERTTAGRNKRGELDGEKGGRVPFGYVRTFEEKISVDPEAAAVVRRIFAERRAGASLRGIAAGLNVDGIRTARGHTWHASSVREVLLNEAAYRGGKRGDSAVKWIKIL